MDTTENIWTETIPADSEKIPKIGELIIVIKHPRQEQNEADKCMAGRCISCEKIEKDGVVVGYTAKYKDISDNEDKESSKLIDSYKSLWRLIDSTLYMSPLMYILYSWPTIGKDSNATIGIGSRASRDKEGDTINNDPDILPRLRDAVVTVVGNHIERYGTHSKYCSGCQYDYLLRWLDEFDKSLEKVPIWTSSNFSGKAIMLSRMRDKEPNPISYYYPRGDEIYTGGYEFDEDGNIHPEYNPAVYARLKHTTEKINDEKIFSYFSMESSEIRYFKKRYGFSKDYDWDDIESARMANDEYEAYVKNNIKLGRAQADNSYLGNRREAKISVKRDRRAAKRPGRRPIPELKAQK